MNTESSQVTDSRSSAGFTLVETIVAMLVITIALLGALQAINYSVLYNYGNATRAQNLAILQQEVERLRAAKFTPSGVDNHAPTGADCRPDALRDITGGEKTCLIPAPNGGSFRVDTKVDDNPFNTAGTYDVDATTRVKEIRVEAKLAAPSPGWQTAVPATVVLRRTIGN
jgi:prepilin-type N-terminal cleavage/methylation domain-containing protein